MIQKFGIPVTELFSITKVTMQTGDGYAFKICVNNNEVASYFNGPEWEDFAECYLLEPGTKLLFDISQPDLIIHVTLPDDIHPRIHKC